MLPLSTTMMRGPPFSLLLLSALCLLLLLGPSSAEVVQLSDATFEHQTQASSGATTGSWFLLFGAEGCDSCEALKPSFEALEQDGNEEALYELGIVLGSVDVSQSQETALRFGIQSIPALLYLHKGFMYRFPSDLERNLESMKEFLLVHYDKSPAERIPGPPSPLDQIMDVINKLSDSGWVYYAFLALVGVMLGTICLLLVTLVTSGKKKSKTAKKE